MVYTKKESYLGEYYHTYFRVGFDDRKFIDIGIGANVFVFKDYLKCYRFWAQQLFIVENQLRLDGSFFSLLLPDSQVVVFDYEKVIYFEYFPCHEDSSMKIFAEKSYQLTYYQKYTNSSYVYVLDLKSDQIKYDDNGYLICKFENKELSPNFLFNRPVGLRSPISIFMTKIQSFLFSYIRRNVKEIKEIKQNPAPSKTNL
ncbi:MAG: hypothetical protein CVU11_14770 [Bacteroidetes bacterium HGW-Bacteroidetes-6]|nr:MAG: hypothetical protein CVU11_14770 [Bacteroidetes bacterium HGW-Bacteroidetes-6]